MTADTSGGRLNPWIGEVTWGVKHIIAGITLVMLSLLSAAAAGLVAGVLYPEQERAVATWISVHLMAIAMVSIVWYLGARNSRFPVSYTHLKLPTILLV